MNRMAAYRNGNYTVELYEDGTKIRTLDDGETEFIAAFPESIDIKVTNRCNMKCKQCFEMSTKRGKHGNIWAPFLKTLHPYTEVALGGGNLLEHPEYKLLLVSLHSRYIMSNITLHQQHVYEHLDEVKYLIKHDRIKGLGISFSGNIEQLEEILLELNYPHVVLHVINGIVTIQELQAISRLKIVPKILILGYKTFGRGIKYRQQFDTIITKNQEAVQRNIHKILLNFPVVSFDTLALEQIDLSSVITPEEYERFYMGDDGEHTMYIDLVEQQYACNSRSDVRYSLQDNIDEMFMQIRKERWNEKAND